MHVCLRVCQQERPSKPGTTGCPDCHHQSWMLFDNFPLTSVFGFVQLYIYIYRHGIMVLHCDVRFFTKNFWSLGTDRHKPDCAAAFSIRGGLGDVGLQGTMWARRQQGTKIKDCSVFWRRVDINVTYQLSSRLGIGIADADAILLRHICRIFTFWFWTISDFWTCAMPFSAEAPKHPDKS